MPIKKDATGKRWVEMELLVPGTPEQVWHAMATGPGNAAWFSKMEIEPRVGGTFRIDFGEGVVTSGEVTMWEPPHQFGYVERDWEPGAPPVATEIAIAARSGDRCVLRMVHSLFTSSDDRCGPATSPRWNGDIPARPEGLEQLPPCLGVVVTRRGGFAFTERRRRRMDRLPNSPRAPIEN
jgi:uncharacterized protein YndB with AHSA1/START domain